jgi:ribose-phosphate pyrophosphokinase
MNIGDVDGRTILIDDIVDSAGTLCNAAAALKTEGAVSLLIARTACCRGARRRVAKSEPASLS